MPTASLSHTHASALWARLAALALPTGFAFTLYVTTGAPGFTWAHHGADGGDLLAAAVVNGVPHPTGYPLYMVLLQGWLALGLPWGLSPAALGNLFSAFWAAASVAVTVAAVATLLTNTHAFASPSDKSPLKSPLDERTRRHREWLTWGWAMLAGLSWGTAPLLWSQALITEVYALHAFLMALMGWAMFGPSVWPDGGIGGDRWPWIVGLLMGLGMAHHVTTVLLWPALLCALWLGLPAGQGRRAAVGAVIRAVGLAGAIAILAYARILLVASGETVSGVVAPPPVNWGYAQDWEGFWWVVSGAPYRDYLFAVPRDFAVSRALALGGTLVTQFTPVGLALALGGLAIWDQRQDRRRMLALLWVLPISIYAVGYNTADSQIYLLPVVWLACLWLAQGLAGIQNWVQRFWPARLRRGRVNGVQQDAAQQDMVQEVAVQEVAWPGWILLILGVAALLGLAAQRAPQLSLRDDQAAQDYLESVRSVLEPGSVVISTADAETFALWYGAWATDSLIEQAPDLVLINSSLYQFDWYRRLLQDLYPEMAKLGSPFAEVIDANRNLRPIYFTDDVFADEGPSATLGLRNRGLENEGLGRSEDRDDAGEDNLHVPPGLERMGPLWRLLPP